MALTALVVGLCIAAVLLAPWRLVFTVDADNLYDQLYHQAVAEAADGTLGWLAAAGTGYQRLRDENARKVATMASLSALLSVLTVVQTLAWVAGLLG